MFQTGAVKQAKTHPVLKCGLCGGRVLRIYYGFPDEKFFEGAIQNGERQYFLGGCCYALGKSPEWQCEQCGAQYRARQDVRAGNALRRPTEAVD